MRALESRRAVRVGPWVLYSDGDTLKATKPGDTFALGAAAEPVEVDLGSLRGGYVTPEQLEQAKDDAKTSAWQELYEKLTGILSPENALQALAGFFKIELGGPITSDRLPLLPLGSIRNIARNFIIDGDFSDEATLLGNPDWDWDDTDGVNGDPGCAYTMADGTTHVLHSNNIEVGTDDELSLAVRVKWVGLVATGNCIQLNATAYDANGAMIGGAPTVVAQTAASGTSGGTGGWGTTLSGDYEVPANAKFVVVELTVLSTATAGTVKFDKASAIKSNLLSMDWVKNLVPTIDDIEQFSQDMLDQYITAVEGIPVIGGTLVQFGEAANEVVGNALEALAKAQDALADLSNIFNSIVGGVGRTAQDFINWLGSIPDTHLPGVRNILDNLFNGFLGLIGIDSKSGASQNQAMEAINNQREVSTSAVSAVTQIAAALAANNASVDDFERVNSTGLGPRWTILTNGATGAWAIPGGHDAQYTGNADYENICIYDTLATSDTGSVSMVLGSAATYEPFILPTEFGSNDLWYRVANTTASFAARTGLRLRFRSDGLVTLHWFQAGVPTQLASATIARPGSGATLSLAVGVEDNPRKFLATINGAPLFNGPVEDTSLVTSFGPDYRKRGHGVRAENLALLVTARPGRLQQWMTEDSFTIASNLFGSVGNYRDNIDLNLVNQGNQAVTTKVGARQRQPEWASPYPLSDVTYPWILNGDLTVFGNTGAQTAGTAHTHPISGTAAASPAMWSVNANSARGGYVTAGANYMATIAGFACNTDAPITSGTILVKIARENADGSISDPWTLNITPDVTTITTYRYFNFSGILDGMVMRKGERVLVWAVNTTNTTFRMMGIDIGSAATPFSGWQTTGVPLSTKDNYTAAEAAAANTAGTVLPWIMIGIEEEVEDDRTIVDDFNRANLGPMWAQFADNVEDMVIDNVSTTSETDGKLVVGGTQDDNSLIVCLETTASDRMRCDIDISNITEAGITMAICADRDLGSAVILSISSLGAGMGWATQTGDDLVADIDLSDQNNNGRWSFYYDLDLNKFVGMKNGVPIPGLEWVDSGHVMPHNASTRYALIGMYRDGGVIGGQIDNFVLRDWKP